MPEPRWADSTNKVTLWDSMYEQEHHPWDIPWASQELVATVLALGLAPGARVLDVGCGMGSDLLFLASEGFQVTGLDISRVALGIAEKRLREEGRTAELVNGDVLNMPFAADSFDFISDRGCYHHVTNQDRPRYAAEVARILRPGGHLLLRGCRLTGEMWVPVDPDELMRLFDQARFDPIRCYSFCYDAQVPIDALMALIHKKG